MASVEVTAATRILFLADFPLAVMVDHPPVQEDWELPAEWQCKWKGKLFRLRSVALLVAE